MEEIKYELVRSKRRTISIQIKSDGGVQVRAPFHTSTADIERFIRQKQDWIKIKQAQVLAMNSRFAKLKVVDGEELPYLGQTYTIRKFPGKSVELRGKEILIPLNYDPAKLKQWLKKRSLLVISARVAEKAQTMGLEYKKVRVAETTSQWGSCSAENNLSFAWTLVLCPLPVLDYVVIHELSHIKNKNHGQKFWAQVEEYCPGYKECRKWLKDNRAITEILD